MANIYATLCRYNPLTDKTFKVDIVVQERTGESEAVVYLGTSFDYDERREFSNNDSAYGYANVLYEDLVKNSPGWTEVKFIGQ